MFFGVCVCVCASVYVSAAAARLETMAQVNGFVVVVVANFACFVLFYTLRFVLGFYFLRVCVMLFGFVVVVAAGYH